MDVNRDRTKKGKIRVIYSNQLGSSRMRNHPAPNYSLTELREWCMSQKVFHELYDAWVARDFDRMYSPSCDRINDYKPYTLDNLQLMTWKENEKKGCDDRVNGINNKMSKFIKQFTKDNVFVKKYYSHAEASRQTGINRQNISAAASGKIPSAGGFLWS